MSAPTPVVVLETCGSTNAEALARADAGEAGALWVRAVTQTAGRGRAGRVWVSEPGNLYASFLFRPECAVTRAPEIALVTGVAVYGCVSRLFGQCRPDALELKWPNDLLFADRKLGGILVERASEKSRPAAVVIGIGINLVSHPEDAGTAATDLSELGVTADPAMLLAAIDADLAYWLDVWDAGAGFERVREVWQARAAPIGKPMRVRLGKVVETGHYDGLDEQGALRLRQADGSQRRITAGDVLV